MNKFAAIRWVLIYTLALNLVATAVKLGIGAYSGSLSVVADGFDSLLNSASNVVGIVGIYVASQPPDPGHPYGHRRFETLASAAIAVLIFATTVQLVQSAISRLRNPITPVVTPLTFVAPLVSIAVQSYVAVYEYRKGRELKSQILTADALHTRADVLVSVSVVAGLILVLLGFPRVDPILALLIAGFIAYIGTEIVRDSSRVLTDTAVLDVAVVERIACEVPGVESIHRIRSRGQEDDIHLDLHVRVAPGMPVKQAHAVAHEVERRLLRGIEGLHDVVVHIEPQGGPERLTRAYDPQIRAIVGRLPGTAVHAIQAHDIEGRLHITLHLEVERSLTVEQAHGLARELEEMLRAEIPQTVDVDVHVEPGRPDEIGGAVDERIYRDVSVALDEATAEVDGVSDCYDLVVNRADGRLVVSARWECKGLLPPEEAGALQARLEQLVRQRLPAQGEVIVHIEPRACS